MKVSLATMVNLNDYRSFLLRDYERRQGKNKSYSMRAFSRDLEMSPQKLNQVLKGKTGLSVKAAVEIAQKLKLTDLEEQLFLALVEAKHHRVSLMKEAALKRATAIRSEFDFQVLDETSFNGLSEWYHWAIYLLIEVKDFEPNADWIATRLGISQEMASAGSEALVQAGLVERNQDGTWTRSKKKFSFSPAITSTEVRHFYSQILDKAQASIEGEPVDQRHFHVGLMPLSHEERKRVQQKVDDFVKGLIEEFMPLPESGNDRVYSLAFALTPLDRMGKN